MCANAFGYIIYRHYGRLRIGDFEFIKDSSVVETIRSKTTCPASRVGLRATSPPREAPPYGTLSVQCLASAVDEDVGAVHLLALCANFHSDRSRPKSRVHHRCENDPDACCKTLPENRKKNAFRNYLSPDTDCGSDKHAVVPSSLDRRRKRAIDRLLAKRSGHCVAAYADRPADDRRRVPRLACLLCVGRGILLPRSRLIRWLKISCVETSHAGSSYRIVLENWPPL